jgi:myo-inositol-1(or 4)-monophosphatase
MDRHDFARALARDAGILAHGAFGTSTTSMKGRHDEVTEMDREVERFIRAAIARRFPGDDVLGEEEGGTTSDRLWIIDPIDGTANFARGIPHYCVSIAYADRGEPVVGVIFDPSHDALYSAARGDGSWRNNTRMSVSSVDAMTSATVECGWSTRRTTGDYVALVSRVMDAGCAIRRAGSGALGLVDVAAGRVESYCELHINSWDCAAGLLLVTEAGGRVNNFFAGDGMMKGNPVFASNAALAASLSEVIGIPLQPL